MTYFIGYTPKGEEDTRGVVMFDIEYYQKESERNKGNWFSELHCLPRVEGLGAFLRDKIQEPDFDYDEFIRQAHDIEEVRGLLWERSDNKARIPKESYEFHRDFGIDLEKKFGKFAEKYGLWVDID